MPRKKRFWHPQHFDHVVMRGNYRQNIFNDAEDVHTFLSILQTIHEKYDFIMVAYCIMTNHYHLLLRSPFIPLSKIMMLVNKRYSDYYQQKHQTGGQLYEKRYYTTNISSALGLLEVSRYIHQNPMKTKQPLVEKMEHYLYSSYQYYKLNKASPYSFLNTEVLIQAFPLPSQRTAEFLCMYTEQDLELEIVKDSENARK